MANSIQRRRYPIGIQDFAQMREDNFYYVDKTDLVYDLANENNYVFMSRPRRFGKSLLVSTLAAYFEGRKELFEGLAMEQLETEWRQYPVLHFSFASVKEITLEGIRAGVSCQIEMMEKEHGIKPVGQDLSIRMMSLINGCYEKYGERVVVLFDEYDAPLLNVLSDPQLLPEVRQLMRTVYAPLKDCGPRLRFLFITGITKFSQLSIFSELNNLHNVSMLSRYATLCGITQQELEDTFQDGIGQLAENQGMTSEEVLAAMKTMYDGYHFSECSPGVYNPFSVMHALSDVKLAQYWFATGTPTFLVDTMRKFHTDITRIDGEQALSTQFDVPTEDMQSILPLFYQSGYITIKDYDRDSDRYTLGYPNKEVRLGMTRVLLPFYVSRDTDTANDYAWKICEPLRKGDPETAMQALQAYLKLVPYQENASSEGHFTSMLYVIFSLLGFYVDSQVRTSDGRMDVVLKTKTHIYVMELKMDQPAEVALRQIDDKGYLIPYTLDGRQLVKIGLSFDLATRTLSEWKIG